MADEATDIPGAEPTPTPDAHARRVATLKAAPEGARIQYQGQLYTKQGDQLVPATPSPTMTQRSLSMELLPIGGALAGGTLGALSPIPGGAAAGSAVGGAGGEAVAQGIEYLRGQRSEADIGAMARTGVEQGAMEAIGGPVLRGAGRLLQRGASKVIEEALPRSIVESGLTQRYQSLRPIWQRTMAAAAGTDQGPRTVGKTLVSRGLMGSETALGIQALRVQRNIWKETILPALKASKQRVNMDKLFDTVQTRIMSETHDVALQDSYLKALQSLRDSYTTHGLTDVPLTKLQGIKHDWAKLIPEKVYRQEPIGTPLKHVQNIGAQEIRKIIYNVMPNDTLKQAYLDYGNLYEVAKHGRRVMTGALKRAGAGGHVMAWVNQGLTPIATIGGQVVYRAGQLGELVGRPGARVVRDIIAGAPEVGRDVRGAPSSQPQPEPAPQPTPQPTPAPIAQFDEEAFQKWKGNYADTGATEPELRQTFQAGLSPTKAGVGGPWVPPNVLKNARTEPLGKVLDYWRQLTNSQKQQLRPILMTRLMRGELLPADRDQLRAALMPNSLPESAPEH